MPSTTGVHSRRKTKSVTEKETPVIKTGGPQKLNRKPLSVDSSVRLNGNCFLVIREPREEKWLYISSGIIKTK
jgi:hypothetical protein